MIARGDDGGLGNLTAEWWRHMRPDRTVVMDLGADGRGPTRLDRFEGGGEVRVNPGVRLQMHVMRWLLEGCDVVYTAETAYHPLFFNIAGDMGVATVLHVMPELYAGEQPTALWAPTTWELGRLPADTRVVPVPIATDRLERRVRTKADLFMHLAAPAMLDRNGTEAVREALPSIDPGVTVTLVHGERVVVPTGTAVVNGHVTACQSGVACKVVQPVGSPPEWWQLWHPVVDVLVLPRRYAGLSMPMLEALAAGIPVLTTDLDPQRMWPGTALCRVDSTRTGLATMKGGQFPVFCPDHHDLARRVNELHYDGALVERLSREALVFGDEMSWGALEGTVRAELERITE